MGEARQIVFCERCKPICADKICYFRDPVLSKRLMPAPTVGKIDVVLNNARIEGRVRLAIEEDLNASAEELVRRMAHDFEGVPRPSEGMGKPQQALLVQEFFNVLDRASTLLPASLVNPALAGVDVPGTELVTAS